MFNNIEKWKSMLKDHFISVGKETSNDIIDLSMDCSDTDTDISIEQSNDFSGYKSNFTTYCHRQL